MAHSKFKCGGCKSYFPKEEIFRSNGVQNFCSLDCMQGSQARSKPKVKKVDIPDGVRKAVLKRDKNRCRFCKTVDGLHLHHIIYRSQGGEHIEHNLITLCNSHHSLIHSDKKRYMPLCLGVVWLTSVERKHLSIPQLERVLDNEQASGIQVR